MKKYFNLMLLAIMPICFAACGSDDDNGGSSGLSASNLIGDWIIIKSEDSAGRVNDKVGIIWSFNSDGTWATTGGSYMAVYTNWSVSDGKLLMTRTNGRIEEYTAEIKDGLLYTWFDRESKVFERVDQSKTFNITSDYFVGTWDAAGGSAYGTWVFYGNGKCNFSHFSAGKSHSLDGTWTYDPSTRMLLTTITNWKWKIVNATSDEWTGDNGQSYKRVK